MIKVWNFNQSECNIWEESGYSTLQFTYDISSWLVSGIKHYNSSIVVHF